MTFVEAIKTGLSKYVTWKGRASRSEFWFFFLFVLASVIVASIIDGILGTTFKTVNPLTGLEQSAGYGYVYLLVAVALFLPNLSVMVRRLHDTGRSGWWYWIVLIPLVGAIVLIVWFATKGTTGSNEYGEDPLGGELTAAFS
jgi:uncharacterized membrane protein YhaH (DUF805 family)